MQLSVGPSSAPNAEMHGVVARNALAAQSLKRGVGTADALHDA